MSGKIKVRKRVRIGKPNPVGEWEIIHEDKRVELETEQGAFSLSVDMDGSLQILGMAADGSKCYHALNVHPEARNKISLSFLKHE